MARIISQRTEFRYQEIVQWIDDYLLANHFAPSVREIGEAFGLSSSSSIHSHLRNMKRRGLIEMGEDPRTIRTSGKQLIISRLGEHEMPGTDPNHR